MKKTKFMQTDGKWGGLGYPKKPWYIRNCGCGAVSIANIIIEMDKYAKYTPATIQPYCKQFAAKNGDGTYWSGIPTMMKHYGLTGVKECATMSDLWKEMQKGNRVAILLMGSRNAGTKKVHWTSGGHFVAAVGYKVDKSDHYLYIKDSYSNSSLRNGWCGYKTHLKGDVIKVWVGTLSAESVDNNGKLKVDGSGGKATVKETQRFFGTKQDGVITGQEDKRLAKYYPALHSVEYGKGGSSCIRKLQKWLGLTENGQLCEGTVAAWQNRLKELGYYKGKVNGFFGVESMKAWQTYLNKHTKETATYPKVEDKTEGKVETPAATTTTTTATTTTTKKQTNAQKLVAKAKEFCYPYKASTKKSNYSTGKPISAYAKAEKKYMRKKAKISQTDCGYFVSTCVRACGLGKDFNCLHQWGKGSGKMELVHKGKLNGFKIKAGDIVRYKKKGGGQHTVMYIGSGKIAHAGRGHWFPKIAKGKPWNNSNVKKSTIQVLRAK